MRLELVTEPTGIVTTVQPGVGEEPQKNCPGLLRSFVTPGGATFFTFQNVSLKQYRTSAVRDCAAGRPSRRALVVTRVPPFANNNWRPSSVGAEIVDPVLWLRSVQRCAEAKTNVFLRTIGPPSVPPIW